MIAAGNDLAIVSKLAGHSLVSITADFCTHMLKGIGKRAADGAAALIPRKVDTQCTHKRVKRPMWVSAAARQNRL